MSYEKKSLDSLDKIMDAVFYEEGRLAIINKFGASLDDADKVKATELITKQRTNLDRLFGIYKEQLYPVMTEIDSVSQEMSLLVDKLLVAQNMNLQQGIEVTKVDSTVSEPVVEAAAEVAAVVDAPVSTEEAVIVADAPVEGVVATDGAQVVEETPVPVTVDNASVDVPVDSAIVTDENAVGGEVPANDSVPVDSGTAPTEETTESTEFVLSPIDEDVAPAKEEEKVVEEGAQVVEQQLQSIDAVKEEIANNPELTADEKKVELEKYTRVSETAVKAILVTKAQYEKLLASKTSQKALMNTEAKEEATSEVGGIPAIVGGDAPAEVQADAPAGVLPTIDNAVGATPDADTNGVLPVINETPAATDTPVSTESAGEGVVLPTIVPGDIPADVPGLATTEAVDKQKELQTMIDQANNLYKEGKTQEAQELFDKVGAMNKEMQGSAPVAAPTETAAPALEIPTAESADAAVLVKK